MSISPTTKCEDARKSLEKAKEVKVARRVVLASALTKLHELEAAQPPDKAAIKAQQAKVDQARANLQEAEKNQKEWQETVDGYCNS